MDYTQFIKAVNRHKTANITALKIPSSCAMEQIPDLFSNLMGNICDIIKSNINKFCNNNEVIAIFGLQPSIAPITSEIPKKLNRIINPKHPDWHFCCTLSYMALKTEKISTTKSWHNSKSIVIDFTTGAIIDADRYLTTILSQKINGTVYGCLQQDLLKQIWEKYHGQYN